MVGVAAAIYLVEVLFMPMNLGTPGVDALMDSMAGAEISRFVRKIEKLGYSSLWFPEAFGRDPFALAAHLLTVTDKLIVGTAIANVWKREPVAISHEPMMARVGINYAKPLSFMRDYLVRLKEAPYGAAQPTFEAPIIVAALLPKMLKLAAAEVDGTIPTFITPERTAQIRAKIGPDKLICLQQISMLEKDASKARTAIRGLIRFYLGLPNYLQSFRLMGFGDSDFAAGGSDRLVDAMVAWGDEQAIRDRVAAQYKAGASHVCITPLRPEGSAGAWSLAAGGNREHATPEERALEALAPR
jgi:alkanesulfonate monooxygenase SsuD/methylene tetrahydromethanopterin reductase-like flavin-dependent oxidoreductase (luciferase family)